MSGYGKHFPRSVKTYAEGSRPDIRVPFREIALHGDNENLRLYDVSGPYTDPSFEPDLKKGLPPVRDKWIAERGDTEEHLSNVQILSNSEKAFHGLERKPLRAKAGKAVTQLAYARQGIVTPEMEFVAIREQVELEFVRDEIAAGRAVIPLNINFSDRSFYCRL